MAGLIKKHMCVLVDVDAMIDLLNRGLDISA
jgi:purine-binding chemotaxis protein CheW